jgi:predicted CopG family antitoxin
MTGRPKSTPDADLTERKTITLRRSTWDRLEKERRESESLSSCIDRLLSRRK